MRRYASWVAGLVAVASLCALSYLDTRIVRGEAAVAYCPASTTSLVVFEDFPAEWSALSRLNELGGLRDACLDYTNGLELAVRKASGIRPTPSRWRLWFGPRLVAAQASGQWGFCVRPGVLLRAVSSLAMLSNGADHEAVRHYGAVSYAWRDGFLVFSASENYVRACLASAPRVIEPSEREHEIILQSTLAIGQGVLRIGTTPGLPVRGWLQLPPNLPLRASRVAPLTLADAWPMPPMLSVTAATWSDLRGCLEVGAGLLARTHPVAGNYVFTVAQYLACGWRQDLLPPDWSASPNEWSLALLDVDAARPLPVPELALAMRCTEPVRGAHPLEALGRAGTPLPYEWEGHAGEMIPFVGEEFTLCLSGAERDWLVATRQRAMASIVGKMGAGQPRQGDFVVRLQWAPLAKRVGQWMDQTAEEGFLGLTSRRDIQRIVDPWLAGFGQLGALELVGRRDANRLCVEGTLAAVPSGGRPQ